MDKSFIFTGFVLLVVFVSVLIAVAYYTYAERKIIGWIQLRCGPNRVGPLGLLQPIADGLKLFFKESILPSEADGFLFKIAPILSFAPAFSAWALLPLFPSIPLADDLPIGLLMVLVMTSLGSYGIIIAGWASHSKYALLGSLRATAQVIAYELAMGMTFVGVLMASGSMSLREIVIKQSPSLVHWYVWPLFPLFVIYGICALAETNRAPFDMAESESELVAGFHVEYSGFGFAFFFLAEYANMLLVGALASILFLGGWSSPFAGTIFSDYVEIIPGTFWLLLKTGLFSYAFLWIRATLPRYRYDQIMRLGWTICLPVSLFWFVVVAVMNMFHIAPWFEVIL